MFCIAYALPYLPTNLPTYIHNLPPSLPFLTSHMWTIAYRIIQTNAPTHVQNHPYKRTHTHVQTQIHTLYVHAYLYTSHNTILSNYLHSLIRSNYTEKTRCQQVRGGGGCAGLTFFSSCSAVPSSASSLSLLLPSESCGGTLLAMSSFRLI